MKKVFIISILFVFNSIQLKAQNWPIDPETKQIIFTEVVAVDSVSKDELYLRAKEWFAKTYNDSKEVIQLSDKEAGKIIGKGVYLAYYHSIGLRNGGLVHYTLTVIAKDGRYKYELTDLYHESTGAENGTGSGGYLQNEKAACGGFLLNKKIWDEIKLTTYDKCNSLIESLKTSMNKKTKGENW